MIVTHKILQSEMKLLDYFQNFFIILKALVIISFADDVHRIPQSNEVKINLMTDNNYFTRAFQK